MQERTASISCLPLDHLAKKTNLARLSAHVRIRRFLLFAAVGWGAYPQFEPVLPPLNALQLQLFPIRFPTPRRSRFRGRRWRYSQRLFELLAARAAAAKMTIFKR